MKIAVVIVWAGLAFGWGAGCLAAAKRADDLVTQLGSLDTQTMTRAYYALLEAQDTNAVSRLLDYLSGEYTEGRGRAATAAYARRLVAASGAAAEPYLLPLLQSEDLILRDNAVDLLGEIHSRAAVPVMIGLLRVADVDLRVNLVRALGRIGDERAVAPLAQMLVGQVRKPESLTLHAVLRRALAALGPAALSPLLELARAEDSVLRIEAVNVLGRLRDPRAGDRVCALAVSDPVVEVRLAALQLLAEGCHTNRAYEVAAALADANSFVRRQAAELYVQVPEKRVTPRLALMLEERSRDLRQQAARALARADTPEGRAVLRAACLAGKADIAAAAYDYLIGNGLADLIPVLIEALRHYGTAAMCEDYLNSGQPELERAARAWMLENGHQAWREIEKNNGPRWP